MSNSDRWLLEYKKDVHSQFGEDGVTEKILSLLPETDKWCVEFGAWDGMFLTNTRHLIDSKGYSAVLIEADKKKYVDLKKNYSQKKNVFPVNAFVGFKSDDSLDAILRKTPIPKNFDFLSIDIDGNDYHVWKAVSEYKPKVVVIEFNPTIPTHIRFVQPADPQVSQGSSLLSIVELAREKGYELVSVLPINAFFVLKEYYPLFQIESNSPEVLRSYLGDITYMFLGYDGTVFLEGSKKMLWHRGVDFKESKVQQIPWFLRKFPSSYSRLQGLLYKCWFLLRTCSLCKK
jgi:hypothetical protein